MQCGVCGKSAAHQTVAGFGLSKCGECRVATLTLPGFQATDFRSPDLLSTVKGPSRLVCAKHKVQLNVWEVRSASGSLRFEVSPCGLVCVEKNASPTMYKVLHNIKGDVSMPMLPNQLLYHLITVGYSHLPRASHPVLEQRNDAPYRSAPTRCPACRGPRNTQGECPRCRTDEVPPPLISQSELVCPRCSTGMKVNVADHNVMRCHRCFGAFMDLRRLELAEIDPAVLLNQQQARPVDTGLNCPRCQTGMQGYLVETPLGELEVDLASCCRGIFFDEGEENIFVRATRVARQELADATYRETGSFAGEDAIAQQMVSGGAFSVMMSRRIERLEQKMKEEQELRDRRRRDFKFFGDIY